MFPINMRSHLIVSGRFADALVQNGHEAHLLVPSNNHAANDLDPKVKVLSYPVVDDAPWISSQEAATFEWDMVQLAETNFLGWVKYAVDTMGYIFSKLNEDCEHLLANENMVKQLAKERYDLIVLDSMHVAFCSPMLAYKLDLPVVILGTTNNEWFYRLPHLSNMPSIVTESTDRMSFVERLKSFCIDVMEHVTLNQTTYYAEKYVPEKPPVTALDIDRQALFIFGLYDPVAVFPRPLMPNAINIGDLMTPPGKPLSKEFESLMNQSKNGVILMSLGSLFQYLPKEQNDRVCKAFHNIDPAVSIIWQTGIAPNCSLPPNVHIYRWVPQNDLLAHPNLRVFITHCGFNSYMEAAYHAKPIIAFPLSLDRPRYATAMASKGMGIKMNIRTFTAHELSGNIELLLHNDTYKRAAEVVSLRMRAIQVPVDKRISFWVDQVLSLGADHLRSGTFELSLIEFLMLDVYFLVFICVLCFMFIGLLIGYHSLKFVIKLLSVPYLKVKCE